MKYSIANGLEEHQKLTAAELFWEAFKGKLQFVMKPQEKALEFFDLVIDPNHSISASSDEGF